MAWWETARRICRIAEGIDPVSLAKLQVAVELNWTAGVRTQ